MIPTRIIIHCTDTQNGKRAEIEVIRKDHIENRGFTDIGYHMLIQPDGEVQRGRGLNEEGAHCEGENYHSLGIALVGADRFTKRAFDALRYQLLSIMQTFHQIDPWEIRCHHEFPSAIRQGKTCPNMMPGALVYWYLADNDAPLKQYFLEEDPVL